MLFRDLFFPNRCLECNRIIAGQELICPICYGEVNFRPYGFEEKNPLLERCRLLFPCENAFGLMQFEEESLSRKIVHQLKYGNRERVGKVLAEWTADRIFFESEKPDLLVTIPLHPKKQKARGYNQLHLFANTLSEKFGIPCEHSLLKRNTHKSAQAQKDRMHRSEVDQLFSITKSISDQHVLLLDDVFTTGNTMSAAAWEILKSGNNKVSVLVMAVD